MIPAEDSQATGEGSEPLATAGNTPPAASSAMAVAAAFAMCRAGKLATSMLGQLGIEGASLPFTTATVAVALATFFPSQIGKLAPSDEALAGIVIQASIFFSFFLSEISNSQSSLHARTLTESHYCANSRT
jgi:hypothetical protein